MEKRNPIVRFFLVYLEILCLLENRRLFFLFETFFVFLVCLFFVFLKYRAALLRTLLWDAGGPKYLPCLLWFLLSSFCPLNGRKVAGRKEDWAGGPCWQGQRRSMPPMVYDPRAPRRSSILITASSFVLLSIFEILRDVSSRRKPVHNDLILSRQHHSLS